MSWPEVAEARIADLESRVAELHDGIRRAIVGEFDPAITVEEFLTELLPDPPAPAGHRARPGRVRVAEFVNLNDSTTDV